MTSGNDRQALPHPFLITVLGSSAAVLWWTLYSHLQQFSQWLTYSVLHLNQGSHLASSVEFLLCDAPTPTNTTDL